MPVLSSSKKALRVSERKRKVNARIKDDFKKARKDVVKSLTGADKKKVQQNLAVAYKKFDAAAKKGVIHKNTAARYKSRLTLQVNKAGK